MKKTLSIILALVMIFTALSGCSAPKGNKVTAQINGFKVSYIQNGEESDKIDFHTALQQAYLDGDPADIAKYCKGEKSYDKSNVIEYTYSDNFTLTLSENEDMSDSFTIESENKTASVDNLKVGTTYYVTATVGDNTVKLDSIETADCCPRIINVDGVKNVRDVGGWATLDGGKVKQGLLYRCGRMNESNTSEVNIEITQSGLDTMVGYLGIKTDIDLRGNGPEEIGGITSSPLGESVAYRNTAMPYDPDIYLGNEDQLLEVFHILSDESNYPIAFHCNIGTDRTGMVAFLVNGLLGVSEEDLYRDYCFSNFADIGGSRSIDGLKAHEYYKAVMSMQGDTLSQKIHSFLLKLGVTEDEIQSIISIMKV